MSFSLATPVAKKSTVMMKFNIVGEQWKSMDNTHQHQGFNLATLPPAVPPQALCPLIQE